VNACGANRSVFIKTLPFSARLKERALNNQRFDR
jgi:hypothetical protein